MEKDKKIILLCLDLGFGMFDQHFQDFPDRCFNLGASEQAGMGIAVGMALSGKKPFIYSITNFVLYRPFETIRNYLNHESIPVRIVASGRDKDYGQDGISHWSEEALWILNTMPNIDQYWPETKGQVTKAVKDMVKENKPAFISLRR
jgi:transketolase